MNIIAEIGHYPMQYRFFFKNECEQVEIVIWQRNFLEITLVPKK